ncbi:hypothetical protein GPECTOR_10g998 [Gonium pectorale]|uniref:cyclin-dependent kinase n=1 Tax=Gonium pectorale TaxID=33097 RepID=A0A150GRE2_GONPE|nr:hypothetical protein GPECTOR_10g998 [Gonium pectorale]|eukprot:KXZ52364.1 hypothetical protein GPECTOR_10g998 [Gonium pectorale]
MALDAKSEPNRSYAYITAIGEGTYGAVWRCKQLDTGRFVAVKCFKAAHTEPLIKNLALREVRMLRSLDHPAIVPLLDAFRSASGRVYLVTHRDIKPANVLLDVSGGVKLCDLGYARSFSCGVRGSEAMSPYVVTRWYRSPEVLAGCEYGPAADIWALGCTLAELATGAPLFPGISSADQLWRIMRCVGSLPAGQLARVAADPRLGKVLRAPLHGRSLWQRLSGVDPGLLQRLE